MSKLTRAKPYATIVLAIGWSTMCGCKVYQTEGPETTKKDQKVLVCHQGTTLRLDDQAVREHLNHGDRLGACQR